MVKWWFGKQALKPIHDDTIKCKSKRKLCEGNGLCTLQILGTIAHEAMHYTHFHIISLLAKSSVVPLVSLPFYV